MIHRFVDLLEVVPGTPIWPILTGTSSNWFIHTIGQGDPPFQITTSVESKLSITSSISDPRLSPDETEIVYGYAQDPAFGSNNQNIRVVQADDSGAREDIITDPIIPQSVQTGLSCEWSPDGTKIAYSPLLAAATGTSSRGMVKRVNRDGTGATTLWTAAANSRFVSNITYSASGDYIAFTESILGGANRLWVMEDDGTSPTLIATTTSGGLSFMPAWQRGADVLGFFDLAQFGGTSTMYKCNPDGTGLTSLLSDTGNEYTFQGRLAWLSDDSAMVCLKRTNGTTILNATNYVIATVDGSGGGATDTALAMSLSSGFNLKFAPFVVVTSREAPRIYYTVSSPSNSIASVLEDFTDYRIDYDPSTVAGTPTQYGIIGSSV